jgi:membrane protease subunit (stomatin/prohibitin family)
MGFIEKLRNELVDIIEWVDDSRHTLVWRFPRYHNQIKYGARLIVRPGQAAVFVHQGQIADVFGPGQFRLETRNLPVLSTLAGWLYGFDSPFKAEVYFVSTRQVTDLKWGTPNPVMMRDPDFGPVRVRAFGIYTLKANDPGVLLSRTWSRSPRSPCSTSPRTTRCSRSRCGAWYSSAWTTSTASRSPSS